LWMQICLGIAASTGFDRGRATRTEPSVNPQQRDPMIAKSQPERNSSKRGSAPSLSSSPNW
jgi:hypothetical protein